jgi:hypothetical protein
MHMRSVPLLLVTLLAQLHPGDDPMSRVTGAVIQRIDEITGSAQEHRKVHFTCCFFTLFLLKIQMPKPAMVGSPV